MFREIAQGDRASPAPRMVTCHGSDDALIRHHLGSQSGRQFGTHRHDGRIEASRVQAVQQRVGLVGGQRDVDERVSGVELGEQPRHVEVVGCHSAHHH
ncbi:hypothetical protein BN970_04611 [Mycolicibacterium conceptionense]|uniref:Uncharacterized protein n=1 Tax=Mycolicibacterium conceptionense TaxID=451644 RepID=A0A0U1DPD9_9MYCO|nr:hypothetical protein BN970_04611 [Mycolicibacterium conceptionense]